MKHTRPIFLTAALAFFISACSQPKDVQPATLTPQFGTADSDTGIDVALAPAGGSYSLSNQKGEISDPNSEYYSYQKVLLSLYDSQGFQVWKKEVDSVRLTGDDIDQGVSHSARKVESDGSGNAYVLIGKTRVFLDESFFKVYGVSVYNKAAKLEHSFSVGRVAWLFGRTEPVPGIAVDVSGNTYFAAQQATENSDGNGFSTANLIRRYSAAGSLVWERASSVGVPKGMAVSSDGSVYVAGRSGLARYNSSGTLLWKKSGSYNGVAVSGSSVFANTKNTVYRFSSSGQQQGSSFMCGLNSVNIQDLSGDGNGNVLVSGKYAVGTGDRNAFVRKLNTTGSSQWTSTFGTPTFDDAQGVVAVSTREAYVTGTTLGSLAHTNRGEEDGYVRKLGVGGKPLWTR